MNEPLIMLDNLAIGYDRQPVLSGISLSVARGSFTAILGANGSGKSTLLKTLLGLQPPISGQIHIQSPAGDSVVFGYVPQAVQFDPLYLLSGFDVALMGVYRRIGPGRLVPQDERAFVRECLQALRLKADVIVVSQTPVEALIREWQEHNAWLKNEF